MKRQPSESNETIQPNFERRRASIQKSLRTNHLPLLDSMFMCGTTLHGEVLVVLLRL